MKKIISIILVLCMMLTIGISVSATLPEASVYFNGQPMLLDRSAVIVDGRVLVPVRAIFEAMELEVEWDGEAKKITATKEDKIITMSIDNRVAYVDRRASVLDVAPRIIDDRTMVPVRFVSEACDAEVSWNEAEKAVVITY